MEQIFIKITHFFSLGPHYLDYRWNLKKGLETKN